jgi:hypothetical protein
VSALYFQAYLMAFDLCRRAEDTFRWELAEFDTSYVRFGSWDSLRKGLLAGERLTQDLRRLETAYLERNRRAFEITRSVSLAEIDPVALIELRQRGECRVSLPEALFDRDHPGHYLRRLKSLDVTFPCIVGPYTSVNCTVTLERSTIRLSNAVGAGYARQGANDARFRDLVGAAESIVTSTAQGDSGLFEVSLRDERYLPFEGAGAVGDWHIELPRDTNAFDVGTVTDVVLRLRYSALDGGDALRDAARQDVVAALPRAGVLSFTARRDFPDAWQRFLHPAVPGGDQELAITLGAEHVPFAVRAAFANLRVTRVDLFADYSGAGDLEAAVLPVVPENNPFPLDDRTLPGVQRGFADLNNVRPAAWRIKLKTQNVPDFHSLPEEEIHDLLIVVSYRIA